MTSKDTGTNERLLHLPGRAQNLLSLEDHICTAARLSHALWMALGNDGLDFADREILAVKELAGIIADHASAAEYILTYTEQLQSTP